MCSSQPPLTVLTPRNLHIESPEILISTSKKGPGLCELCYQRYYKITRKGHLISIEFFSHDNISELSSIFPSSVGERENMGNGQNVSLLTEFRFITTLLVIPMDMDGPHWIPSDEWISMESIGQHFYPSQYLSDFPVLFPVVTSGYLTSVGRCRQ